MFRHNTVLQPRTNMRSLAIIAAAIITLPLVAQEKSYWLANRASNDIMEVTPSGTVVRRIDMGVSLRIAAESPIDGQVWVAQIFSANMFIVDPVAGTASAPFVNPLGSAFDIAFDAQGTAWVCGGTGVVNYDASGAMIQSYPLTAGAPLGITIDGSGNKWIAHRTSSGSVSRIDSAGTVVNFPVSGGQPVRPIADYRGILVPSHIWVTCDSGGALLELDENGVELNNYTMPATSIGGIGPVFDNNGDIWVGSFAGAGLFQVDPSNGSVTTWAIANANGFASINGLSVDTLGRILCTQRVTFSGVGPPCEIQRVDPATGAIEVPTVLQIGGVNAAGSQAGVSTPYQWALVVDQIGDADGDGDANFAEIQAGTSPIDAASSDSVFSVDTTGSSQIGSSVSVNVKGSSAWVVGFSDGLVCPGISVPGFLGSAMVDLASVITTIGGIGPLSTPVAIPNNAALQGQQLHIQGVIITAALQLEFRNVTGIVIW